MVLNGVDTIYKMFAHLCSGRPLVSRRQKASGPPKLPEDDKTGKIIFEFENRKIKIVVDDIGNHDKTWDAIREARDRLEAQGINMGSFHGQVTYISELYWPESRGEPICR